MSNEFLELIRESDKGKYCVKLFCTTCGAMKFRDELKRIGYKEIIDQMYSLQIEDLNVFRTWMDCVNLARSDMHWQIDSIPYIDRPQIINYVDKAVDDILNFQKDEKRRKEEVLETLLKEKVENNLKRQMNYKNNRIESNKTRMDTISKFNELDIEGKLNLIAEDYNHFPSYYQLDLFSISSKTISKLDKILVNKLVMRFSDLKKKEWKTFYLKLLNVENIIL